MRDYRKLKAFQVARQLVLEVYSASKSFPSTELFSLTRQVQRAAVSIPANIAEGAARETQPDFVRFLSISMGSVHELGVYLDLSRDLDYLSAEEFRRLSELQQRTAGLLGGLIRSLSKSRPNGQP